MRRPFLYFKEARIRRALDEKIAFRLAEETFQRIAERKVVMPPKLYLTLPGRGSANDFRAMPAFIHDRKGRAACGVKWVSVFPANKKKRLATINAHILLSCSKTGVLLAVLEANTITALRTAAASAVASVYLASPNPKILAIVGAGVQAAYQLRALTARFRFKTIRVWGYGRGEGEQFKNLEFTRSIKACVRDADIIVTCTPSRKPLVKKEWIKPGAHINAIGADAPGKQELDPALLLNAKVVVDDWRQASHSGEINVPVARGLFQRKSLYAELAEIVSRKKTGRNSSRDITIFDSTGLAALDIRCASYVYHTANSILV